MQISEKNRILKELSTKRDSGEHVSSRLFTAVQDSQALYKFRLQNQESFLSLIWQEADPTRLLTPMGQPRTMQDVGFRLTFWQGFKQLGSELGLPRGQHHPEWFERCVQIDSAFDYSRFGCISVTHPTDSERRQSPRGSFYVYDGVHRALVLAKRLLTRETEFRPLAALLIIPRPT